MGSRGFLEARKHDCNAIAQCTMQRQQRCNGKSEVYLSRRLRSICVANCSLLVALPKSPHTSQPVPLARSPSWSNLQLILIRILNSEEVEPSQIAHPPAVQYREHRDDSALNNGICLAKRIGHRHLFPPARTAWVRDLCEAYLNELDAVFS